VKRILVIEDDTALSNGVRLALQNDEYHIEQCFTLRDARQYNVSDIDLIILDVNLPDGNGLQFLTGTEKEE